MNSRYFPKFVDSEDLTQNVLLYSIAKPNDGENENACSDIKLLSAGCLIDYGLCLSNYQT